MVVNRLRYRGSIDRPSTPLKEYLKKWVQYHKECEDMPTWEREIVTRIAPLPPKYEDLYQILMRGGSRNEWRRKWGLPERKTKTIPSHMQGFGSDLILDVCEKCKKIPYCKNICRKIKTILKEIRKGNTPPIGEGDTIDRQPPPVLEGFTNTEIHNLIEKHKDILTEKQIEFLNLSLIHNWSYTEIGRKYSTTKQAVHRVIQRAQRKIDRRNGNGKRENLLLS